MTAEQEEQRQERKTKQLFYITEMYKVILSIKVFFILYIKCNYTFIINSVKVFTYLFINFYILKTCRSLLKIKYSIR